MSDSRQVSANIFADAARDLCGIRKYVFAGIAVFFLGIAAGTLFPARFIQVMESFRDFVQSFRGRSTAALILMIFLKNSSSALLSVLVGALFGIVPLFAAAVNGVLIGVVFSSGVGKSIPETILLLVPHGIFELPAIFISWGSGIWLGNWWMGKGPSFRERLRKALRIFFVIVLPLLVIAAAIEGSSIGSLR